MQIEIPQAAFAMPAITSVIILTIWLIRRYGVGLTICSMLTLLGTVTLCLCMAIFAARIFCLFELPADVGVWLVVGSGMGLGKLAMASVAALLFGVTGRDAVSHVSPSEPLPAAYEPLAQRR